MTECKLGHAASACASAGVDFYRPDFTCCLDVDIGAVMGAEPAPKELYRRARNSLIVALILSAWSDPDRWIAYSRDAGRYSTLRRYFGATMSLRAICWAVETLEQAQIVEHRKTRPSSAARFSSTIRATSDLLARSPVTSVEQLRRSIGETIRLKDKQKRLQYYRNNSATNFWRRDVEEQNEALDGHAITLAAPGWHVDERGLWTHGTSTLNPARNQYYRIFNGDWSCGGRWYGPFWQSLPGSLRTQLRINREPVVELDYATFHPRLLAAEAGVTLDSDAYEIDGWPRKEVKRGFNVLLNANSRLSAIRALQLELAPDSRFGAFEKANALVAAIERRHPHFVDVWGTGKGLRLQSVDAAICMRVQMLMRDYGHPVLSIHDSFICISSHKSALEAAMEAALADALQKIASKS